MAKQVKIPNPTATPENWEWIKIGDCVDILSGFPFDSGKFSKNCSSRKPLIRIRDVVRGYTETFSDEDCPEIYTVHSGDILVGMDGNFNVSKWKSEDGLLNQRVCKIKSKTPALLNDFLYYYLPQQLELINEVTPSVTVKHLSTKTINLTSIPIPPIAEQQRIVDRIESLFAKLDQAKEITQNAVESFKIRNAAILHKAFTGELTAKWREKHGINIDNWHRRTVGEIAFVTKLAGFEYTKNIAPNLSNDGIPLFKGKNIRDGQLVLEFESFIPKSVSDELFRSKLTKKCLLTPYVGTIGNIAIFDGSFEAHLGSNVGKIELITDETFEEFLLYYLRSDFGYSELTKQKKATAQESISIRAIREVIVNLPTIEEQREIVRILDSLFEKEQQAAEQCNMIDKIDLMKKAILARAFRGELGTNDPKEESAMELLKKCVAKQCQK